MLLDEYGSVQQHLQPRHIQESWSPLHVTYTQQRDKTRKSGAELALKKLNENI